MRREFLHLFAENLPEISLYCRDMSSIVCRHLLCRGAGSICKRYFSIYNIYGAVRRNIQEPGFTIVRHNRAKPCRLVLPVRFGVPVEVIEGSALLVHSSAATTAAAPCFPVQFPVPISPLEMLSTVTPSSPIRTPTFKKNVQTTSSLAS